MQNRRIVMNAVDHVGLSSAIGAMDRLSERGRTEMIALRGEWSVPRSWHHMRFRLA